MRVSTVYFIQCGKHVKIGTTCDVRARMRDLLVGTPHPLKLIALIKGDRSVEKAIHHDLMAFRSRGEWFRDCPELRAAMAEYVVSHGAVTPEPVIRKSSQPVLPADSTYKPTVFPKAPRNPWFDQSDRLKRIDDAVLYGGRVKQQGPILRDAFRGFMNLFERAIDSPDARALELLPAATQIIDGAEAALIAGIGSEAR